MRRRGIDGRNRRPGLDAERHDPDQDGHSTAVQGIRVGLDAPRLGHRAQAPPLVEYVNNERCLAAFAIAASPFAPAAHANDALEGKVRAYVPVVSLAKVCDIRINDAALGDHRAMLEAVKSDPSANKLAYRVHYETQTAYVKAHDGGQRVAFCRDFIAANSQYAKARFTAEVEDHMSDVSTGVQKAIAHNVCGAPPPN